MNNTEALCHRGPELNVIHKSRKKHTRDAGINQRSHFSGIYNVLNNVRVYQNQK